MAEPEPPKESLIEFPCRFPIKALGSNMIDLDQTVFEIIKQHAPDTQKEHIKIRPSKNGRYISVTATIEAVSQQQLDAIYEALSAHDDVLMAF